MNPITKNKLIKNITLPSVMLIGSAALTLFIIGWLLKYCHYGLDLTDESFYLNWIANPWIYKASISQFGFIYHPLHLLTHGHIDQLRQINLLIIFALSWTLFLIFFKTSLTTIEYPTFWRSNSIIVIAASLATSGFSYCCPFAWLISPSYNSLTFQALLIAGIGALLAEKTISKNSLIGWMLIGVSGWLCFMAKPSSAAALFFVMGSYLLIAGKLNIKQLCICLLTTIALFFISGWLIDGSMSIFIKRHFTGFANMKLMVLENKLFKFDKLILNQQEKIFILIGSFILCVISCFTASTKKYVITISYAITFILLLTSFLSIFNLLPVFIKAHYSFTMQIIIIPFSAVLIAITLLGKRFFSHINRSQWALMLFFLVLPYVCAFGTSNNYWYQSQLASCFWVLSGLALLIPAIILEKAVESTTSAYCTESSRVFDDFLLHRMGDTVSVKNHQKHANIQHISHSRYDSTAFSRIIATSKWPVLIPLAVTTQLLTILLLQHAMDFPYRQNQPLGELHNQTTIETTHSTLILNEEYSTFYQHLQTEIKKIGLLPGTPIIDLTGQSPGLLYIMNGKAIGQAWTIGGYPGSDNLALASLSDNVSCEEITTTWILIEPESPQHISSNILKHFGINIEKDYTLATEFTMPKGMGDENNNQRNIQLLKPYRTAQKGLIACKKIKRAS